MSTMDNYVESYENTASEKETTMENEKSITTQNTTEDTEAPRLVTALEIELFDEPTEPTEETAPADKFDDEDMETLREALEKMADSEALAKGRHFKPGATFDDDDTHPSDAPGHGRHVKKETPARPDNWKDIAAIALSIALSQKVTVTRGTIAMCKEQARESAPHLNNHVMYGRVVDVSDPTHIRVSGDPSWSLSNLFSEDKIYNPDFKRLHVEGDCTAIRYINTDEIELETRSTLAYHNLRMWVNDGRVVPDECLKAAILFGDLRAAHSGYYYDGELHTYSIEECINLAASRADEYGLWDYLNELVYTQKAA